MEPKTMKSIINQHLINMFWENKAITNKDFGRLISQITEDVGRPHVLPNGLHTLYLLLKKSKIYEPLDIPKNIITINSKIVLITETGHKHIVSIVMPGDIKNRNDVSIYSPIGLACFGAKEKDYVNVNFKNNTQRFLIEKVVFQPEKEKLLYL